MNADLREPIAEPTYSQLDDYPSATDDPRVGAALDVYLAELQAGHPPSREEFLGRYPEIAEVLDRNLNLLEFVDSAAGSEVADHAAPPPSDSLPPETILGDFRLVREIGRGGMGVVYEARQISLDRRVAVKVLSAPACWTRGSYSGSRSKPWPSRSSITRTSSRSSPSATIGASTISPCNISRAPRWPSSSRITPSTIAATARRRRSRRSLRCPFRPGTPRPEVLAPSRLQPTAKRTVPAPRVRPPIAMPRPSARGITFQAIARLAIQAAQGLDHAHAIGILHRDIKPSNLLLDPRGELWIADFGLARFQDDPGPTLTGDLVGTVRYMAPELASGGRLSFDPRSDIYALGATLYELVTRRPVFDGKDRRELLRQIAEDEPIAPRRIDRAIPRNLETIVMTAMAKEPERRYPTARELADDLGRFLADEPIRARPISGPQRASPGGHGGTVRSCWGPRVPPWWPSA